MPLLQNADYNLTGQLVWPGAELLNECLSNNTNIIRGRSINLLSSWDLELVRMKSYLCYFFR
ncbi:hypothetical protein QJS10_CPB04g01654 [Acorus calamus]|uniref:Uncharacterized protein n=1 Tax=Acorus calamus TaxID=4465 RepID=A0AAV9F0W1_ACOCL|nr:hypothetical protein QJS10_CPB04g01654 [Acorus calamus]